MSNNRNYIMLCSSEGRCSSYKLTVTSSDPYHHARVRRYDQTLRRTLSKIFRERRLTSGQIRKLIRPPGKHAHKDSIFNLILERNPALGKLLLKRGKLSLLWIAILSGYQDSVELLVRSGADLNEPYGSNSSFQLTKTSTVLHALLQMYPSAWNQRFIGLVIEHSDDLNARDSLARTVLHLAARNGRVKVVERLLEKRVDVNAVCFYGMTPLYEAARTSEVDKLLPLLMKYGAEINARDIYGHNILYHLALSPNRENVELARVLIEKGISPHLEAVSGQNQPIHEAVLMENIELVNLFLDHGANVNARGFDDEFPLCIAAECDDPAMLRTLLNRGANIDLQELTGGQTALHRLTGSDKNTVEKVKILLSVGADMFAEDHNGSSLFDTMCRRNNMKHPSTRLILKTLALKRAACLQLPIELEAEKFIEEAQPGLWNLYQHCIEEIDRLKQTKFINSCTFFELLTKCQCQMVPLMRNREFESRFRLYDLSVFFPMYAEDILEAFERAKHYYQSVLNHEDLLDEAFGYRLPFIVSRMVTSYVLNCETCAMKKIVHASRGVLS